MKNYYLILLLLTLATSAYSQTPPDSFSYSAVVRNSDGTALASKPIGLQFTIMQGAPAGNIVYQENQSVTTNPFGVFTVAIGAGVVQQGYFAAISWGNGPYYLGVGYDSLGGSNFVSLNISQFLSVPYAMYADSANNVRHPQIISLSNDTLYLSNGGSVYLGSYRDSLIINNDTLALAHGNKVVLPTVLSSGLVAKINDVPITDPSINDVMIGPNSFLTSKNYRYDFENAFGGNDSVTLSGLGHAQFVPEYYVTDSNDFYGPYYTFAAGNWGNPMGWSPGRVFLDIFGDSICYIPLNAIPVTVTNPISAGYPGQLGSPNIGTFLMYRIFPNDPAVTGYNFPSAVMKLTYSR